MEIVSNLEEARIDPDTLALLTTAFELYDIAKLDYNVYRKDNDLSIPKNLITQYYKLVKPNYNDMIFNFRRKYVSNELLVEKNDTPEERQGLNLVYDYIQGFDISKDSFNIFINAMQIHSLLYRPLDQKWAEENEASRKEARTLYEEAKKERNLKKLRQAKELIDSSTIVKFGGTLRKGPVLLHDFAVDVPEPDEAIRIFNEFLTPERRAEYESYLNSDDIFSYIDYAVNITSDLIGVQPFGDGNKRTFRSLLNLMFKMKNLPPVYITRKERKAYHTALEKALVEHDYSAIDGFYYYKICDSIYELDFKSYVDASNATKQDTTPVLESSEKAPLQRQLLLPAARPKD